MPVTPARKENNMRYYSIELGSKLVNKVTGAMLQVIAAKIGGDMPFMVYLDSCNKPLRAYGKIESIQAAKLDVNGNITNQTVTISEKNDMCFTVVYHAPVPDYLPDINEYSVENGELLHNGEVVAPKGELVFKKAICSLKNSILLLVEHVPSKREALLTYKPLEKRSLSVERFLYDDIIMPSELRVKSLNNITLLYRTGELQNGTDALGQPIIVPGFEVFNFVHGRIEDERFFGKLSEITSPIAAESAECTIPVAFVSYEFEGEKRTSSLSSNEWHRAPFGYIHEAYYCGTNFVLVGEDSFNINETMFYGACPVNLKETPWLIDESDNVYSFTDDRCTIVKKYRKEYHGPAGCTLKEEEE